MRRLTKEVIAAAIDACSGSGSRGGDRLVAQVRLLLLLLLLLVVGAAEERRARVEEVRTGRLAAGRFLRRRGEKLLHAAQVVAVGCQLQLLVLIMMLRLIVEMMWMSRMLMMMLMMEVVVVVVVVAVLLMLLVSHFV